MDTRALMWGQNPHIHRTGKAAIHRESALSCVNRTVNYYEYQSSVTLPSNKSHLARVESLQPSNVSLIVRFFWLLARKSKKEPTHNDGNTRTVGHSHKHTYNIFACSNICIMYKYTHHENQHLIFITHIRTRPVRSC